MVITDDILLVSRSKRLKVSSPSRMFDILNIKLENNTDIMKHILKTPCKSIDKLQRIKALSFIEDIVNRGAESTYIIYTYEFTQQDIEYIKNRYTDSNIVMYIF